MGAEPTSARRSYERQRTHGGRVAHLIAPGTRRLRWNGKHAICGAAVWLSADTPHDLPTCKACERKAGTDGR